MNNKILYPSCSESIYKIKAKDISKFKKKQMQIFEDTLEKVGKNEFLKPILIKGEDFLYNPYFEKFPIDLFLDYFNIPSERNHWTGDGTSYMNKKDYTKLMKEFCKFYHLKFKDKFKQRKKFKQAEMNDE